MKFRKKIGLLAAFAALVLCVALAVHFHSYLATHPALWFLPIIGIVPPITYKSPVPGFTAPTAAQVYGLGLVSAQLVAGDTDTQFVITHNFGLDTNELAALFPIVVINADAGNPNPFTYSKAANTVTLNKASTAGTGGTFDVFVLRPHTNQTGVGRQNF